MNGTTSLFEPVSMAVPGLLPGKDNDDGDGITDHSEDDEEPHANNTKDFHADTKYGSLSKKISCALSIS